MPKAIRFSVGRGGQNCSPQDVMTVQYLLNCVPYSKGGPSPELAVDGIAEPITLTAIARFQQACLSHPDGRVDPGGPTLSHLQQYDPYPGQPMPSSPSYKQGHKYAGIKDHNPPGHKSPYPPGFKKPYPPGYKEASPGGFKQTEPAGYKQNFPPVKGGGFKQGGW